MESIAETPEPAKTPFKTFGLGCFHFALREEVSVETESPEEYFRRVTAYLKKDNLVENVEVSDDVQVFWPPFNKNIGDMIPDDGVIYPWPSRGEISFSVHMPHRLQEEYLGDFRRRLSSQKIYVNIYFTDDLPVAFVTTENVELSPSTAVVIIWKHLRKISNNLKDDVIFQMLGPSPFHADFYAFQSETNSFSIHTDLQAGYDDVTINIPDKISDDHAFDMIKYRISEEASIYYKIILYRNKIRHELHEVLTKMEALTQSSRSAKWWNSRSKLDSVYDNQVELEKISLRIEDHISHTLQAAKRNDQQFGDFTFSAKVMDEIDALRSSPVASYQRICSTMQDRLSGNVSNGTNIASALAGALVGALITLITTFISM